MNRKGQVTWLMVAVVAVAIAMIPITKWLLTMHSSADDLQTRMAMQQIITDKWNAINAEEFEALDETIAANGDHWTETAGDGNRYSIETVFGDKGTYTNTICTNAAPGEDDRRCRQVSIQITDAQTGKAQAVNLTKADSRYLNSRMKKIEDDLASLNSSVSSLSANISSVDSKFGNYYKKSETYSRAETDAKINSGSGMQLLGIYDGSYGMFCREGYSLGYYNGGFGDGYGTIAFKAGTKTYTCGYRIDAAGG